MGLRNVFSARETLTPEQIESRESWLQGANAVLLGIAAVATAFAGYRSAILGGDALADYTRASRTVNEASQAYTEGNQQFALDQTIFLEYIKATLNDDTDLAKYFKSTLGSQELTDAIDEWETILADNDDSNDTDTPFQLDAYVVPSWDSGDALIAETDALFASGEQNDDRGDRFDLAVAMLATALFLYGISAVSRGYGVQVASLTTGTVVFVASLAYMATI